MRHHNIGCDGFERTSGKGESEKTVCGELQENNNSRRSPFLSLLSRKCNCIFLELTDTQEAEDVGTGEQIAAGVEFCGGALHVVVDPSDVLFQIVVCRAGTDRVDDGRPRQRHIVRPVHEAALLQDLPRTGRHGGVPAFDDALAAVVGEGFDGGLVEVVHPRAGEAVVARDVQDAFRVVELGRRRRDDVPSQQGPALVLDLVDGPELAVEDAVRLVHVPARVGERQRDRAVLEELRGKVPCDLPAPDDHAALSLEGVTLVQQHLVGEVRDGVPGSLRSSDERKLKKEVN